MMAKVMNTKDKKKWTTALRSGHFEQGEGKLFNKLNETYCCLGVAQCVLTEKTPKKGDVYIPRNIAKRFGLSPDLQAALAVANDGHNNYGEPVRNYVRAAFTDAGYTSIPKDVAKKSYKYRSSFKHIADWIDENL